MHVIEPRRVAQRSEVATFAWLTIGSILLPVVGWAIAVQRLWRSSATWTTFDKIIGSMIWPIGVLAPLVIYGFTSVDEVCVGHCPDPSWSTGNAPVWLVTVGGVLVLALARLGYRLARS